MNRILCSRPLAILLRSSRSAQRYHISATRFFSSSSSISSSQKSANSEVKEISRETPKPQLYSDITKRIERDYKGSRRAILLSIAIIYVLYGYLENEEEEDEEDDKISDFFQENLYICELEDVMLTYFDEDDKFVLTTIRNNIYFKQAKQAKKKLAKEDNVVVMIKPKKKIVMESIYAYLFWNILPEYDENFGDIYVTAHEMRLEELKEHLRSLLLKQEPVTKENVVPRLKLLAKLKIETGERWKNVESIWRHAVLVFNENFEEIMETEEGKQLEENGEMVRTIKNGFSDLYQWDHKHCEHPKLLKDFKTKDDRRKIAP